MSLRGALLGIVALLATVGIASACPECASREGAGVGAIVSIGAMIALPFAIAAVIVPVIRRGSAGPRS